VSGLARREVADRAGADSDYVGLLIELDVLMPQGDVFSPGDVRRGAAPEVLVTQKVRDASDATRLHFTEIGPVDLNG